ncbi:DAK2 domain-containing protein [Ancylomarina sp. 16SWW S1-10-2]|uniref:DAK2 domain-containing protein n=1 Tax=Ancylomarina sp. 16SWW S1-10-2 TaxID=2499681 RepID=UPI0012AE6B09|nr:DegV family protein [Ancylomarina sp. 16SWW S1-10-2]MRT92700.1 DegV family EDD domain-containing protein [Ancylomarina sp. 16SWW S1-10-2]
MNALSEQAINGKILYYGFIAGSLQVLQNQVELNRINVFPVRDKDTGSNLASTIRAVIDNIKPHKSYKKTIGNIAEAALIGARGNSGVIFAQFLYGLSKETKNKNVITLYEFAESVKKSIPYIYEAIANPVEGTMLTVIRDWSDFLSSKKEGLYDFQKVIVESIDVLEKSLNETTSKLKALKKFGFVDAGAKGFVFFIKGVIEFIKDRNIRNLALGEIENVSLIHTEESLDEEITFRYCTEAIIKNLQVKTDLLKQILVKDGDSVVVAGSENTCRIHIHTNHPAQLFDKLKDIGTITFQKVDDMQRQQEVANKRKWNIALVTDSTCDLSQDLIDFYQINIVPLNLNFGDNHYLDKITLQPEQFYNLLDSSQEFPNTSQINERTFTNLYSQLASHYDAIISVHLTSQFSGTFANSVKAGQRIENEFKKPVYNIDSKNLSGALGLLVLKAAQSIEAGKTAESIVESIKTDISNTKIFVSVKELKYMIKGGRVSKPAGFIANALGINPVISMDEEGKSLLFGKTFSQKASLKKIFKHIEKIGRGKSLWNYIVLHAHNPDGAKTAELKMLEITGKKPVSVVDISPVIGMHAGNGAIAISLLFQN